MNDTKNCNTENHDNVNHPSHYTSGKIEVIDFIEDQKLPYHLGNVVKYISRAGKKDPTKTVEDLEKARWYLDRYIKLLKGETEQTDQFRDGTKKIEPSQTETKKIETKKIETKKTETCDCYHIGYNGSECWGTREKDPCSCGGDKNKCDFYGG